MGLFKNMRDLAKQANEISASTDVGAQLADAQTRMADVNRIMADQTAAANAGVSGVDAKAVIVEVRQAAAMVNFQPMIELDLIVLP
jgi:hypothetical protein